MSSSPLLRQLFPRKYKKDAKKLTNTSINFTFVKHFLLLSYYSIIYPHEEEESPIREEDEFSNEFFEDVMDQDLKSNLWDEVEIGESQSTLLDSTKHDEFNSGGIIGMKEIIPVREKLFEKQREFSRSSKSRAIKKYNAIWKTKLKNLFRICLNVLFLILNILIVILQTNVSVQLSYNLGALSGSLVKGFEDKFSKKAMNNFLIIFFITSGWVLLSSFLKTIHKAFLEQMMVGWRWILASNIHRLYFSDNNFFWSRNLITNPDQRIQADTDTFVVNCMKILENAVSAPFSIVIFTYNVFYSAGWQAPLTVYIYFLLGLVISRFLIGPVAKKWEKQKELEGDLRCVHSQLRSSAESIAMLQGGQREKENCNKILKSVSWNRSKVSLFDIALNFHMNNFGYLGGAVNYGIIGICAFYFGTFRAADVAEFTTIFHVVSYQLLEIIYGFTTIVQVGDYVSELSSVTGRLGLFFEAMKDAKKSQLKMIANKQSYLENTIYKDPDVTLNDKEFLFYNFTLCDPSDNVLISDVHNLYIRKGMHTLISGASGTGKSTLLRTLCDMWPHYNGYIHKPRLTSIYVVPQNPYCSNGTLKEQITYPISKTNLNVSHHDLVMIMKRCMKQALLEYLIAKDFDWNEKVDWPKILSAGEQQRLAFCRFFFHLEIFGHDSISWLIMDESTSSLDLKSEELIMNELLNRYSNITLISVGHRPTLKKFHQYSFELGNGIHGTNYTFTPISA